MANATTCDLCGEICIFNNGAGELHFSGPNIYKLDLCETHGKGIINWIKFNKSI